MPIDTQAVLTPVEQETMNDMLFNFLWAVRSYSIENNAFPTTRSEAEKYNSKVPDGYDIKYEVTEKDGKVEEFTITIFNPAKTYMVSFESSCYKESGKCMENYQVRSMQKMLEGSQIKLIE